MPSQLLPYFFWVDLVGKDNLTNPRKAAVNCHDVLYVEDAARGLLLALKATKWSAGLTHVFNIGTGLDYSVREITGAVLTACGVPVHPVLWGPEQELGAAAKVVVPSSHLGFQHKVSLADGLARTVAWYRENCTT